MWRRRMRFWTRRIGTSTIVGSPSRPHHPTIFIGDPAAASGSTRCFASRTRAPCRMTGWSGTTIASFKSRDRVSSRRRAAPSTCSKRRRHDRHSLSRSAHAVDRNPGPATGARRHGRTGTTSSGAEARATALRDSVSLQIIRGGRRSTTIREIGKWHGIDGRGNARSRDEASVEAAGAVDAKSTRPPLLGKPQNGFPQASTDITLVVGVGGTFLLR